MIGYADALLRAVPAHTLWLVVAPLVAGTATHVLSATRRRSGGGGAENADVARLVGAGSLGIAAGAVVGHAVIVARQFPAHGALVEPLPGGFRVGSAELRLVLCYDLVAIVACGIAALAALGIAARLWMRPPAERPGAAWARIEVGLAGTFLAALADDVPTMALGWSIASAACAWRAAAVRPVESGRIAARAATAMAALLAGGVCIFHGSAGAFSAGDETANASTAPPLGAVPVGSENPLGNTLGMVSWPGAAVSIDDARAPAATAPFAAVPLSPGHHDVRVRPGGPGATPEEVRIDLTAPPQGEALAIESWAATLSFRDLAVSTATADAPTRHALQAPVLGAGGSSVDPASLAFCAWIFAACAIISLLPRVQMPEPGILGLILLARAAVLAPLVHLGAWAVGLVIVFVFAVIDDRRVPEDALERTVSGGGRLLVRFERWVLDATASAAAGAFWAAGWMAGWVDAHVVQRPGDAVAARLGRTSARVEPWVGGSLARLTWVLLAAAAAAVATLSYAAIR
ncbi:MAG: hypothetical protein FWD17_07395 [Polyangiaceae bacterium]|nr:hypothetical protein [Polyangiaceae bacterium]